MNRVCVFCGSKVGMDPAFSAAAAELGGLLARQGLTLVYGGGSVGLMGVLADAVLEARGEVVGVIPKKLATKELLHPGVEQMHVVESMHARKALMAELADAFIALPGGFGTLEELFEVITWAQLGLHGKPVGLLNTAGYFAGLVKFLEHAVGQEFIKARHYNRVLVEDRPATLLASLAERRLAPEKPWITPEET
jgi:uncharacterized protein (TIGR00730 family)